MPFLAVGYPGHKTPFGCLSLSLTNRRPPGCIGHKHLKATNAAHESAIFRHDTRHGPDWTGWAPWTGLDGRRGPDWMAPARDRDRQWASRVRVGISRRHGWRRVSFGRPSQVYDWLPDRCLSRCRRPVTCNGYTRTVVTRRAVQLHCGSPRAARPPWAAAAAGLVGSGGGGAAGRTFG